jgi:hypothetical protein
VRVPIIGARVEEACQLTGFGVYAREARPSTETCLPPASLCVAHLDYHDGRQLVQASRAISDRSALYRRLGVLYWPPRRTSGRTGARALAATVSLSQQTTTAPGTPSGGVSRGSGPQIKIPGDIGTSERKMCRRVLTMTPVSYIGISSSPCTLMSLGSYMWYPWVWKRRRSYQFFKS